MHIVLATPLYPPEPGGPATYAKLLEEGLPSRGIEVTLVKFSDVRKYPKVFRHMAYKAKVKKALKNADAVLALDPASVGYPAMIAAKEAKKPLLVKIVGDYAWEQGTQRFGVTASLNDFVATKDVPFPVKMLRTMETAVAREAKSIVVPSKYLSRIVAAWGIPGEKITVIYNAPPVLPDPSTLARPSEPKGPYITTVARLVPWKGIAAVIRAIRILADEGSELSLAIVGDGPEQERLVALTEELGLKERVVFVGRARHGDAARYMRHAEAFVLNTCYEGFSHVILEAFALGVPVLTTNAGGNPEQVEDERTGLIFPFDDADAIAAAVRRLRDDASLRERVIAAANTKAASFSRERMLDTLAAHLRATV